MENNTSEFDETVTIRMSSEMLDKVDQQLPSAQRSETIRQLLKQSLTPVEDDVTDERTASQKNVDESLTLAEDKYVAHLETQIQQKDTQIQELTSQVSELLNKID
jgi:metal-responsive CopG/Arc/MetJ family transcriptional regulator